MQQNLKSTPTVFVVFGATGDLSERKIFPALYHLFKKDKLPELLNIIGFSRRNWSDEKFKKYVKKVLKKHKDAKVTKKDLESFLDKVSYKKGDFENLSDFKDLAEDLGNIDGEWQTCANKLFYLAVPPKYYKILFSHLEKSGLTIPCGPDEGWTRVIVEKPFGKDLKTAQELDRMLAKLFKEEQIFRIDHYLGKDLLQNILAFRFSNNIFEQSWNSRFIESIEVKLLEKDDVGERGAFYDGVGTLKDVGQNHLLQMLSLVTMENPRGFESEMIRKNRLEILKTLTQFDKNEVIRDSFRAQYEGFREEKEVRKNSNTETYFKTKTHLRHPNWRGVNITLEAGKAIGENKKEIVVRFKHPTPCLCPPGAAHDYHNKVIFALEPKEEITFRLWYKKPGFDLAVEKRSFDMQYKKKSTKDVYTEEYEKLLLDCFLGDQTLFVSTEEVEAMWRFVDPLVRHWEEDVIPLETYKKGSSYIREKANRHIFIKRDDELSKQIGIVGLGKMGSNIALNLLEKGWKVVGYNRSEEVTKELEKKGLVGAYEYEDLYKKLAVPRVVLVSVPAGEATRSVIEELSKVLNKGDIVVDFGNSFYQDSIKNHKFLAKHALDFVDVGISGGPRGARNGASLMVGGNKKLFDYLTPLYRELSVQGGYEHFEGVGAGHFVKIIHNGIEYGMMQAISEGFDILKNSDYKLHLKEVAWVYNHGTVIESKLIDWLQGAYEMFGDDLKGVSGKAGSGGSLGIEKSEAKWTVDIAKKMGMNARVIQESVQARIDSQKKPSYQSQVINALRHMFGGHEIK